MNTLDTKVMLKEVEFFKLEYCFVLNKSCTCTDQVNLVDWLKVMVASCRQSDEVVDPSIEMEPSTRALFTTLRCVGADVDKKPKCVRWYACLTLMSLFVIWKHYLVPIRFVRRHFEKMVHCDPQLNELIQQPIICFDNPFF